MNTVDPQAPYRIPVDMPPANHDEGYSGGWDHTATLKIVEPGTPEHDALTAALFPNDMDKPTEHEPLLSDADFHRLDEEHFAMGINPISREDVRDFYESKITSGELRVVKEVHNCNSASVCFTCSSCCVSMYKVSFLNAKEGAMRHCPNCGGKIVVL